MRQEFSILSDIIYISIENLIAMYAISMVCELESRHRMNVVSIVPENKDVLIWFL